MLVKRLTESSRLPVRGSAHAAGYDLYADEDVVIGARSRAVVSTGIAITVPDGTYGRIAPRSGLAVKHGIDIGAGVIDADFCGNLGVVIFNHDDNEFAVRSGDRIAQLIIENISTPEVREVDELAKTARDVSGWGSTGR